MTASLWTARLTVAKQELSNSWKKTGARKRKGAQFRAIIGWQNVNEVIKEVGFKYKIYL